jgi:(1->4)-alpha-D-glucan 1-alpha-D-glucosylmutase
MTLPRATARLQLHSAFTLDDARIQVPYFARLGISHLYLSPISRSRPGSMHGYDVVDPAQIDPELGGEAALRALAADAREHGMGLVLDIVPNHMATHPGNAWWWDVLQNGPGSAYASWLDIDWNPPDPALRGKVLAPFLDRPYGLALAGGAIQLVFEPVSQSFQVEACGARYPLAPGTLTGGQEDLQPLLARYNSRHPDGQQILHELLERQHYRLSWWRYAADGINWRRFFEISELIGVRVEQPAVFDAVHALPLRLFAEGLVDGLRIDHIDGLADPTAYCLALRAQLAERAMLRPGALRGDEPWLIVEKILAHDETPDPRWPVHGTTGYDFMDQVGAVLHDPAGEPALVEHWAAVACDARAPSAWVEEARKLMLDYHFAAERRALLDVLSRLAQTSVYTRDYGTDAIARVLDEVLTTFPIYRTYADRAGRSNGDTARFNAILERVRRRWDNAESPEPVLLDMLDAWLGGIPAEADPASAWVRDLRSEATRRFQQLTPPLAAKSLEDTVFYRYGPLLSRNEVGSDLSALASSSDAFHQHNMWRAAVAPWSMLATATHDHKRGEDVRARLAVLSEMPRQWAQASSRWLQWQGMAAGTPAQAIERYLLFQTLVGAWPPGLACHDRPGVQRYIERVAQWQIKALREAKRSSSWFNPDLAYEQASTDFVHSLEPGGQRDRLLPDIADFVQTVAPAGIVNSLAQTILRVTAPGVPDLYQGTEFWDFSLVDPDNRRAVDFPARRNALDALAQASLPALLADWESGRIKQALLARSLQLRRDMPGVFALGEYFILPVLGRRSAHVLAFMRSWQGQEVFVIAPRLCAAGIGAGPGRGLPAIDPAFWANTGIVVPRQYRGALLGDALRGTQYRCGADGLLRLDEVLSSLPVALLFAA